VEDPNRDARHRRSLSSGGTRLARRVRAYVGLGANVGDAAATIAAAIRALAALSGARLRGVSPLYATAPVGPTDQPEFRNAVVALDVPGGPDPATGATALLVALKSLERSFGRRHRERWGPRELDLDLLVFGRSRLSVAATPEGPLVVPHPEAARRLFVLAPLADLAPQLRPPGWGETVESARRRQAATERAGSVRAVAHWSDTEGWT
jgi:2-amino-4-hydroxy-6-hydroxymethyldihydropteridine diphosphokinase